MSVFYFMSFLHSNKNCGNFIAYKLFLRNNQLRLHCSNKYVTVVERIVIENSRYLGTLEVPFIGVIL
jgi:hypothetical protein